MSSNFSAEADAALEAVRAWAAAAAGQPGDWGRGQRNRPYYLTGFNPNPYLTHAG